MRRRLYFVLPDVASARRTADELLLARIEDRHMHFLARRGTDLGPLHEAGFLLKTDALHGAGLGFGLGAAGGLLIGAAAVFYPIDGTQPHPLLMPAALLAGGAFGAWAASMAGAAVPNSRLQRFSRDIEAGRVLMMADVPLGRVTEIRELVLARHPEALPRGQVRPYPVFP